VKDAAITAGINAELARDSALSAIQVNVDTNAGKVLLRGTAPSAAARDKATELARNVTGVVSVDNQLQVGGR
jgi:hyperosmotically inducible periplasmic protein